MANWTDHARDHPLVERVSLQAVEEPVPGLHPGRVRGRVIIEDYVPELALLVDAAQDAALAALPVATKHVHVVLDVPRVNCSIGARMELDPEDGLEPEGLVCGEHKPRSGKHLALGEIRGYCRHLVFLLYGCAQIVIVRSTSQPVSVRARIKSRSCVARGFCRGCI